MTVKVADCDKAGDSCADGIKILRLVLRAVEVNQLNVYNICLDYQHLILRIFHVSVCQTGVNVVSDKSQGTMQS